MPRRAWIGPVVLVAVLLAEVVYGVRLSDHALAGVEVGPAAVSDSLFGPYVLGVELASMLLLAALVGARHVASQPDTRPQMAPEVAARAEYPGAGARRARPRRATWTTTTTAPDEEPGVSRARGGRLMAAVSLNTPSSWPACCSPSASPACSCGATSSWCSPASRSCSTPPASPSSAAGARWGRADGQVMFIFVLAMAAAEVAVGLAIAIRYRQQFGRLDVDDADEMKG